jgi:YbgC/YbaW family acyl-CoA thioester hydrolase
MPLNTTHYTTELQVRPDDLDMFRHVHSSRYMDYVLAARYEQMSRCYGYSMESFLEQGLAWVIRKTQLEFKRPLLLGDSMIVETWIHGLDSHQAEIHFRILRKHDMKVSCEGGFHYALMDTQAGKAIRIPEWVIERYSLPDASGTAN